MIVSKDLQHLHEGTKHDIEANKKHAIEFDRTAYEREPESMRHSNRSLLGLLALFALTSSVHAEGDRPNILFIYTDDQSYRTVGCYPEAFEWVRTPNIDRLARQGVRFDHAYIGSWCMPSRATMNAHGIPGGRPGRWFAPSPTFSSRFHSY